MQKRLEVEVKKRPPRRLTTQPVPHFSIGNHDSVIYYSQDEVMDVLCVSFPSLRVAPNHE